MNAETLLRAVRRMRADADVIADEARAEDVIAGEGQGPISECAVRLVRELDDLERDLLTEVAA